MESRILALLGVCIACGQPAPPDGPPGAEDNTPPADSDPADPPTVSDASLAEAFAFEVLTHPHQLVTFTPTSARLDCLRTGPPPTRGEPGAVVPIAPEASRWRCVWPGLADQVTGVINPVTELTPEGLAVSADPTDLGALIRTLSGEDPPTSWTPYADLLGMVDANGDGVPSAFVRNTDELDGINLPPDLWQGDMFNFVDWSRDGTTDLIATSPEWDEVRIYLGETGFADHLRLPRAAGADGQPERLLSYSLLVTPRDEGLQLHLVSFLAGAEDDGRTNRHPPAVCEAADGSLNSCDPFEADAPHRRMGASQDSEATIVRLRAMLTPDQAVEIAALCAELDPLGEAWEGFRRCLEALTPRADTEPPVGALLDSIAQNAIALIESQTPVDPARTILSWVPMGAHQFALPGRCAHALFVNTTEPTPSLYCAEGAHTWRHLTTLLPPHTGAPVRYPWEPEGMRWTPWSSASWMVPDASGYGSLTVITFGRDEALGHEEGLLVPDANGTLLSPLAQGARLYVDAPEGFVDHTETLVDDAASYRNADALCAMDLEDDGDPDYAVAVSFPYVTGPLVQQDAFTAELLAEHHNRPFLLHNRSELPSFSLQLVTASGAVPDAAVVEVSYATLPEPVKVVVGGGGATRYLCRHDTAFVGWREDNPVVGVTIHWPDGSIQVLDRVPEPGHAYVVHEE
jgi:hypothetical protein